MKYLTLFALATASVFTPQNVSAETIAYVNEKPITTDDVAQEISGVPDVLTAGRQEEIQKAIIERLIQKRLVMEEADKLGITEDKTFKAQLATLRENLIFNFVLAQKLDTEITPIKLRAYYEENKEKFKQSAINVGHILLDTENEAKQIIKQLKNGDDFKVLAQAMSLGPSAAKGGSLGWVKPGEMVQPFEQAAFALKAGESSQEPLKTQFGWHVVKVFEKDEAYIPPFPDLEETLQQELSEKVVKDYLTALEKEAKIRYEAN